MTITPRGIWVSVWVNGDFRFLGLREHFNEMVISNVFVFSNALKIINVTNHMM